MSKRIYKARAYLVLAISLSLTLVAAAFVLNRSARRDRLDFEQIADSYQTNISEALQDRITLMQAVAGTVALTKVMSSETFQQYVDGLHIDQSFADVQGIGYAERTVDPDGERYRILYLEPRNTSLDVRAVGLDMSADPILRLPLERSRDSALPAISGIWSSVPNESLLLMCLPSYASIEPPETVAARRHALQGFIVLFIQPDIFLQNSIGAAADQEIAFSIYAGNTADPTRLLHTAGPTVEPAPRFTARRRIDAASMPWTLVFSAPAGFRSESHGFWLPSLISAGVLLSFALFVLLRSQAKAHIMAADSVDRLHKSQKAGGELRLQLEENRTKLKDAQDTLRSKEARLQIALSAAQMASWHWDLVTGNLEWNDVRYTWADFLKLVHTEDQLALRKALDQALQERQNLDIEFRTVQADGTIRWVILKAKVFLGADGRPASITGVTIDVTDRHKSAEALRASEERYRLAARATNGAIWDWDLTTGTVQWNEGVHNVFGYELDAIGKDIDWRWEQIHPDDRERVVSGIHAVIRGGGRFWSDEYRFRCADGSYATVTDLACIEHDESGHAVRLIAAMTDVTRLKQAQREREQLLRLAQTARVQAESANRLKDEFLATLSHELRTPITPILGWTQLLRNRASDHKFLDRGLDVIEQNARSQARLIDDLLDVSRIITGKMQLKIQNVQADTIIQTVADSMKPAADAKSIRIETAIERSSIQILADPDRLQQVVWNLLSNAIKFTPAGGMIRVSSQYSNNEMRVVVSDTGEGIAPEFLPHVFDRFSQADSTNMRVHAGLGVGLALVRHIVELHGGTVAVDSAGKGAGATFTVVFPTRATDSSSVKTPKPQRINKAPTSLNGLRLLIVDDEPDTKELLASVLDHEGAIVSTAESVQQALALFETDSPDILISDIAMPGENGYALLEKLREIEKRQGRRRIPAIALTAFAREDDRKRAFLAGFDMHLSKPVESAKLISTILDAATQYLGKTG